MQAIEVDLVSIVTVIFVLKSSFLSFHYFLFSLIVDFDYMKHLIIFVLNTLEFFWFIF